MNFVLAIFSLISKKLRIKFAKKQKVENKKYNYISSKMTKKFGGRYIKLIC